MRTQCPPSLASLRRSLGSSEPGGRHSGGAGLPEELGTQGGAGGCGGPLDMQGAGWVPQGPGHLALGLFLHPKRGYRTPFQLKHLGAEGPSGPVSAEGLGC